MESPEYIAKVFGTRTVEKITKQYDTKNKKSSKGSIREVEEYIVHPNDLKLLKTGQAYCKLLLTNANQFIKKIDIKNYEREKVRVWKTLPKKKTFAKSYRINH